MLTNDIKREALKAVAAQRKEKSKELVIKTLTNFFERDMPIFDLYYIHSRMQELLKDSLEKIDFASEEITALRKKHLAEILELANKNLPRPREFKKKLTDATEIRDARCEPLAFDLLRLVLDPELILTDDAYIALGIEEHEEVLFRSLVEAYIGAMLDGTTFSFDESLAIANRKLWANKRRDEITARQLDTVLKG